MHLPWKAHLRVATGRLICRIILQPSPFLISNSTFTISSKVVLFKRGKPECVGSITSILERLYMLLSSQGLLRTISSNYTICKCKSEDSWRGQMLKIEFHLPFGLRFFRLQIVIHMKIIVFSGLRCRIHRRGREHFGQINEHMPLVTS